MKLYKIVVHNRFGEFYPLGKDIRLSDAMIEWYLYESDSATAKSITNPVNIIMLVEEEPPHCKNCGFALEPSIEVPGRPWIHTHGYFQCFGERTTLAEKEDE